MAIDFNYFLGQKYAQLQQQADAGTSDAASRAITANAAAAQAPGQIALTAAQTGLVGAQATELPADSASARALQGSQVRLNSVNADAIPLVTAANVAGTNAQTQGQLYTNKTLQALSFARGKAQAGALSGLGVTLPSFGTPLGTVPQGGTGLPNYATDDSMRRLYGS